MGYLERFARNKRGSEKTRVLTARLPESLYSDFQKHCDELGLSISEAVCLLVEHEISSIDDKSHTDDDKKNDDVVITNTEVVDSKQVAVKKNTISRNFNTNRFTTKQWQIDGELPCPVCHEWRAANNFSRHAKQHDSTTEKIFTDPKYIEIANQLVKKRNTTE